MKQMQIFNICLELFKLLRLINKLTALLECVVVVKYMKQRLLKINLCMHFETFSGGLL